MNVSERPYPPDIVKAMKEKDIAWEHIPVSETDFSVSWLQPLIRGVLSLNDAYENGLKMVVHCDFGNNRSRTFIEAFHFFLTGEEFPDEPGNQVIMQGRPCSSSWMSSSIMS